jgi:hypothetical protein
VNQSRTLRVRSVKRTIFGPEHVAFPEPEKSTLRNWPTYRWKPTQRI